MLAFSPDLLPPLKKKQPCRLVGVLQIRSPLIKKKKSNFFLIHQVHRLVLQESDVSGQLVVEILINTFFQKVKPTISPVPFSHIVLQLYHNYIVTLQVGRSAEPYVLNHPFMFGKLRQYLNETKKKKKSALKYIQLL